VVFLNINRWPLNLFKGEQKVETGLLENFLQKKRRRRRWVDDDDDDDGGDEDESTQKRRLEFFATTTTTTLTTLKLSTHLTSLSFGFWHQQEI